MEKLQLFLQTLDCSYGIKNVCYDGNVVTFTVFISPQDLYENILVKFGLQDDVTVTVTWSYDYMKTVISVNINRLLIDDVINDMLSA